MDRTLGERVELLRGATDLTVRVAALDIAEHVTDQLHHDATRGGIYDEVGALVPRLRPALETLRAANLAARARANALDRYARYHAPKAMVDVLLESVVSDEEQRSADQIAILQEAWLTDIGVAG